MMPTEKTEHYTIMFNTFVFMQVFNEINARKLGKMEFNSTIIVQILLVQYGGQPIRTSPLTLNQHLLCLAIGIFSLL